MAKRESAASSSRRGMSDAQRKALAKGRAKRDKNRQERLEREAAGEKMYTADEKWSMLLSGTLTVKDMDDKELKKMRFRAKDGSFAGVSKKVIPSHIAQAITAERIRRAVDIYHDALPKAIEALVEIIEEGADGEIIKTSDVIKASQIIQERVLGKPDSKVTLTVEDDPWGRLTTEALEVDRDV